MLKQAWRSYLASLHSGNLEKMRNEAGYMWMYVVFFISWGVTTLITDQKYADTMWAWFLRMTPVALMLWSDLVSKLLMPKNMFLCPMKEEERKEYIHCVLFIKIGVVVVVAIIVELIWSIFYGFSVIRMCIVAFAFFSIGIANYIGVGFKDLEKDPFVVREKNGNFLVVGLNTLSVFFMMFFMYAITAADLDNSEWSEDTTILFIAVTIFFVLALLFFDIMIIKEQYKYVIKQSTDYELHFKVKGRVESPKKKYELSI